jgi:hypothetical protein
MEHDDFHEPQYLDKIRAALQAASLALSASHNLTVTDRSDLPRDEWPTYRLDHAAEIALIDETLLSLDKKDET